MKWREYSESENKTDNLTVKLLFLLNSENPVIHRYLQSRAKSIRGKWRTSRLSCLALAILNFRKSQIS